jgi:hypothetical protein
MLRWLKKYVRRAELSKPLPYSNSLAKFCQAFEAHTEPSDRKFHRLSKVPVQFWTDAKIHDEIFGYQPRIETVEGVAIHIPIHKLEDFVSVIDEQKYKEMHIRDNVPAVKKAYEQYRMLLKMCGGDYDAGY